MVYKSFWDHNILFGDNVGERKHSSSSGFIKLSLSTNSTITFFKSLL